MISKRTQLLQWIDAGAVGPEQIFQALAATGVLPDGARWRRFLDQLMLILGALALVCAVVFFIAYNWDALGHFAQFALVQGLMVLAVLSWWRLGAEAIAAKVALLVAAMLLGALLALYGQTYQTGADSWQLFATWALFMLPWTLVGRFAALWLMWLVLLNVSAILYLQVFRGLLWISFNSGDDLLWLLFMLNTLAWILWELASSRFEWLAYRWPVRLIAVASGIAMALLVLHSIFGPGTMPLLTWLVFAAWLVALYFVYRDRLPDLFMLAGACLALIVCLTSLLAKLMLNGGDVAGVFLLLAFLVVAQAAAAAFWLRRIHQEQSS
jgi:uncharacterized membrane protein